MTTRRTLALSLPGFFTLPFALSACAKAATTAGSSGAGAAEVLSAKDGVASSMLAVAGGVGATTWLAFTGDMRTGPNREDSQPAKLWRAVRAKTGPTGPYLLMFDVLAVGNGPAQIGAVAGQRPRLLEASPSGFWLEREFSHPGLGASVEASHLARDGARMMLLSGSQIWLLEGGQGSAPALDEAQMRAFTAWQAA